MPDFPSSPDPQKPTAAPHSERPGKTETARPDTQPEGASPPFPVSVVIACYERPDGLRRAIAALEKQTWPDFELIVVDQTDNPEIAAIVENAYDEKACADSTLLDTAKNSGPSPGKTGTAGNPTGATAHAETTSQDPLKPRHSSASPTTRLNMRRVVCRTSASFPHLNKDSRQGRKPPSNASHARNHGVLCAQTEIVCFTDDDCVPAEDWVEKISLALRTNPHVIMTLGPRMRPNPVPDPVETRHRGRQCPALSQWQGGTSSMAFRKTDYLAIGGLDTSIGPGTAIFGSEDQHLIYRFLAHAGETGQYVVNQRDAAVEDTFPATRRARLRKRWTYMWCFGAFLGRETHSHNDTTARQIFHSYLLTEGRKGIGYFFRSRQPLWAITVPLQTVALLTGWIRSRRLPAFCPEPAIAQAHDTQTHSATTRGNQHNSQLYNNTPRVPQ